MDCIVTEEMREYWKESSDEAAELMDGDAMDWVAEMEEHFAG